MTEQIYMTNKLPLMAGLSIQLHFWDANLFLRCAFCLATLNKQTQSFCSQSFFITFSPFIVLIFWWNAATEYCLASNYCVRSRFSLVVCLFCCSHFEKTQKTNEQWQDLVTAKARCRLILCIRLYKYKSTNPNPLPWRSNHWSFYK